MAAISTREKQVAEIVRSGRDVAYFLATYAKIVTGDGLVPFDLYPFQRDCLDDFVQHRFNVVLKSRQLGLSTVTAGYALWLALFYKHQSILVIATKRDVAMNFIKKVKTMLRSLPKWIVLPTIVRDTMQEIEFSHGSSIKAIPTSEDAARSESLQLLVVDECVGENTYIDVRNKCTGEARRVTIKELMSDEYQ